MPRISQFFGIVIAMYANDHAPPHFHAKYAEYEALIAIETLEVLRGSLRDELRRWCWNGRRCIETSFGLLGAWR